MFFFKLYLLDVYKMKYSKCIISLLNGTREHSCWHAAYMEWSSYRIHAQRSKRHLPSLAGFSWNTSMRDSRPHLSTGGLVLCFYFYFCIQVKMRDDFVEFYLIYLLLNICFFWQDK